MREVERATVGLPPRLQGDLSEAIADVRQGKDARNDIYAHADVVERLKLLYLAKCYLCERELLVDGVVEHFLPWHKDHPERAYDWKNLHWSCGACNQRKKKAPYRVPSHPRQAAVRTDLLDPSSPPPGKHISDLIQFEPDTLRAVPRDPKIAAVVNTATFLNDAAPLQWRLVHCRKLAKTLLDAESKGIWQEIAGFAAVDVSAWNDMQRGRYWPALPKADSIYSTFLREGAPFAVSMRAAIHDLVGLTSGDFRRMSDAYRSHRQLPLVLD